MTQNNFKFAITGGIGSGKSTVAEIIRRQNYAVFSCDAIYEELLQDKEFLNNLSREFDGVVKPDGTLDRIKLSEKVFNDKAALERLNAITHPAIMEEVFKRSEGLKISFTEVPLLFESSLEEYFDGVIVVLRDINERIEAVSSRDKIDRESVVLRIKSQLNYENNDFAKYYVIHNDGKFDDLEQKTVEILKVIKSKYL
ncbi:MAG: dephospho-CoA kinase [Clostridia bacterium]|nr:dephospho-CoA kinase [Clostridia bacterium]